jgi:PKD repeat protein
MKKIYIVLSLLLYACKITAQVSCNPNGNMLILANYDGGILNINCDQNIPNLKIGVVSYEPVIINLTGPYASSVSQLIRAGFPNTDNNNCNLGIFQTAINGPTPANYSIVNFPAATLSNPNGYSYIICAYSCDNNTNQGGCNTIDQVVDYFSTALGGTLLGLKAQYCCWQNANVYSISSLSNQCCTSSSGAATISYPNSTYCSSLANTPAANITGTTGGSFSSTPGLDIDPITGVIHPSTSLVGQYTISYSIAGCPGFTTTTSIEIGSTTPAPIGNTPQLLCNGADINDLVANGNGIQWYAAASGGNPLPVTTQLNNNMHYYASQVQNGCESTNRLDVLVQFSSPGILNVSANGPLNICQGGSVTLTATAGYSNYQWSNASIGNSLIVTTPGTFTVSATDLSGCIVESDPITISNTSAFTLSINPANPTPVCEGESILLIAENGYQNYTWSNNQTGSALQVFTSGSYSVSAENTAGCVGSSAAVQVDFIAAPSASFTYAEGTNLYQIQFTSQSQASGTSYLWTFENGITSTEANPSHTFPFDATWPTSLIVTNACGADTLSMGVVVLKSGITELNGISNISLSPNPGNELLKINGFSQSLQNITIQLYGSEGKLIQAKSQVVNSNFVFEFNMQDLSTGIYAVVLSSDKQKRSFRWIKN